MARLSLMKVSDKLTKVGEVVNVYRYDNGFMCEVSGRNATDDWSTVKLICRNLAEVQEVLLEVSTMPRE
jgi:hypothetical protein